MLEELLRDEFYKACHEVVDGERMVMLKSRPVRVERKFVDFFKDPYPRMDWKMVPLNFFKHQRRGSVPWRAWLWFNEHGDLICRAYIKLRFSGDIQTAMTEAGGFNELFDGFKTYFSDRRESQMEKVQNELTERKAALAKQGKSPQSHGGVANLLKVLTKTMHDQGSSVYTIAKVQYAVCMQAGIFIPDEFLTDVLVAQSIMDDGNA